MNLSRDDLLVICSLLVAIFLFQYASGAYHSDFSADDDEPAHVVSSLMVRDYVAQGFPGSPLHFAENYYVRYPKVAIGHWPPLFYTAEATWMLLFGRTRATIVAFPAVIAALLEISIFLWVRGEVGTITAFLSAIILLVSPPFGERMCTVAPDMLLALLALWSAMAYGTYLKTRSRRPLILFAFLVICALLVHGRGAMLLFLVPITELLIPKPGKLKWLPVLLLLCAVTLFVPHLLGQAAVTSPSSVLQNAGAYLRQMGACLSWVVWLIAMIGAFRALSKRDTQVQWMPVIGLVASGWAFQSIVNVPVANTYVLTIAAPLALLFAGGLSFLIDWIGRNTFAPRAIIAGLLLLVCCVAGKNLLVSAAKRDTGFHNLIPNALDRNSLSNIVLVDGDPRHEGALIAEVALSESQPRSIVLRASKVLAASSWSGKNYRLRFPSSDAVASYLKRAHVGMIFEQQRSEPTHARLLADVLRTNRDLWHCVETQHSVNGFKVFRETAPISPGAPDIRIDMREKLGQYIAIDE